MSDFKSQLKEFINTDIWKKKDNYILGYTEYTYEALKIIRNSQEIVAGIFSSEQDCVRKKNLAGIPIKQYSDIIDCNILLSKREYIHFGYFLYTEGYRVNKNLFVDFGISNGKKLILLLIRQFYFFIRCRINSLLKNVINKSTILRSYIREFFWIFWGGFVYQRIKKDHENCGELYVYDYSGLGDVFVFCGLLANQKKLADKNICITVIGKASAKIVGFFSYLTPIVLSNNSSRALSTYIRLFGEKGKEHLITPFPRTNYVDSISATLAGKKINMLQMYKYVYFKQDKEDSFCYPKLPNERAKLLSIFLDNNLQVGKTVVLSPYANTVIGYDKSFWEGLNNFFVKKGYSVCTNCGPDEHEIEGTSRVYVDLICAEQFLDLAGYFVGLRSGFCDIICNSSANKIIIYPIYRIFNSNLYEFCSFEKMGIGQNITEIKWKHTRLNELQEKIETFFE